MHAKRRNGRRGLQWCLTLGFGHSCQVLLNKFLDPSSPYMRKVDNWGKGGGGIMKFIVVTNVMPVNRPNDGRSYQKTARGYSVSLYYKYFSRAPKNWQSYVFVVIVLCFYGDHPRFIKLPSTVLLWLLQYWLDPIMHSNLNTVLS